MSVSVEHACADLHLPHNSLNSRLFEVQALQRAELRSVVVACQQDFFVL
jgi:hypothetical protein